MKLSLRFPLSALMLLLSTAMAKADEKPVVGLIPRAVKAIQLDGKLDDWEGAFITPVHVGHPDFANRGGEFLYLWDDQNLYIGLRCLDRSPWHSGAANQIWNGDAVEFYLDTRSAPKLGAKEFGPGTLHMFWTPFTNSALASRIGIREIPAFKDLKLKGAEVAGAKTRWGYTAEFKLPWANFPEFKPAAGTVIGLECELCSSDGGPRVDRTFVYASPAAVGSPSAFGRVQLVDKLNPEALQEFSRVLMPVSVTCSHNYAWVYASVCVSPTIEKTLARLQVTVLDAEGKTRIPARYLKKSNEPGIATWSAAWEMFHLPPGQYKMIFSAQAKDGKVIVSREVIIAHNMEAKK